MPRRTLAAAVILFMLCLPAPAPAQEDDSAVSVTQHTATIGGRQVAYTATAGHQAMKTEKGEHRANIFYIAYTKDGDHEPGERPITFVFNGGPGSSSVWLHLGTAGPKRVLMDDDGMMLRPPGGLVANEHSWLDLTDLVFIDPVGTGYSRPEGEASQRDFSGLNQDIESVGDFIRLYVTANTRWSSPKFLAGESYGTTRAAGLAGYLQNRHGMYLNGIMMISTILNFQTARFDTGNDLPYPLFLPTYTATAWYHNKLDADLQRRPLRDVLDEVEAWAIDGYTVALAKGDALPEEERSRVVHQLARYTGLRPEFVEQANLRIVIHQFVKELRRDERLTVGRLDSRFTGIDRDAAGARIDHDPSLTAITGPYTASLNDYVRRELGYENDIPYEILTGRVQPWSYASHQNRYVNVAETLREAMSKNNYLHVLFASGYYDLATPHFACDYTIAQMGLEPHLRDNIHVRYYESGHMMYIQKASLVKLKEDIAAFVRAALEAEAPGR